MANGSVTPTFVIGIGEAGTRMTAAVRDVVEAEGLGEEFGFFAIDTENDALAEEMPPNRRYHLPKPDVDWDDAVEDYDYLNDHLDKGGLEGTKRQRPLGRFYLDDTNNAAKLIDKLQPVIEDFADGRSGDAYIWIINSLGGGSGSGLFPLVTGLLQEHLVPDISSSKRGADIHFEFMGIGAIPYINDLQNNAEGVKGDTKYAANAYTALRELRAMQGHDGRSEVSIQVKNPPISLPNLGDITLKTPLFKRYFLLSQQEDVMDTEKLNRLTGNLVLRFANSPISRENVPDANLFSTDLDDAGNFYTFDGGEIRVPVEEIVELTEYQRTIAENEETIEDLETEISTLDDETDYLEDVLNGRKPDSSSKVVNQISQLVGNYSLDDFGEDDDYESETVRWHVKNRLLDVYPKREQLSRVDAADVLTYRYYVALEKQLRQDRNTHAFVNRVERQWTEILSYFSEDQLRDKFAGYESLDDASPMQKWRVVVKPHLIEVKDKLERQDDDDGGMFGIGFGGIVDSFLGNDDDETTAEEVKEKLRAIQGLSNQYETVTSVHERIRGDRSRMRQELRNQKSALEDEHENLKDRRDALQDEIDRLETQREGKLEEMADPPKSLITSAPIDPDYIDEIHGKMTADAIESGDDSEADDETESEEGAERVDVDTETRVRETIDSLQELVDSNVIDRTEFAEYRNYIVDQLHRTDGIIEDQSNEFAQNNVLSGLVVLYNEENESLLGESEGEPSVEQAMEFLGLLENDNLADPFSIRFIGLYTGLDLVNTSELGVIHQEYTLNPDDAPETMGKRNADRAFIEKRFAYPELLGEDDDLDAAVVPDGSKRLQDRS
jgi:cell division protein FtsB